MVSNQGKGKEMKPKWEDAPDWANWLAMDANKSWWWFESKPTYYDSELGWNVYGDFGRRAQEVLEPEAEDTLEPRAVNP